MACRAKTFTIKDIQLRIQAERRRGLVTRRYYLECRVGDTNTPQLTKPAKETENTVAWTDKWIFDGDDRSVLVVGVYQKHHNDRDELIASLIHTIGEVLETIKDGVFERTVDDCDSRMTVKFSFSAVELQAADAVAEDGGTLGQLGFVPRAVSQLSSAVDASTTTTTGLQTFETTLGILLKRLDLFNKIVADIASIHPYASLTWSVISAANRLLVNQKDCDDQIIRLANAMSDVFSFVHDAEPLKAIKAHLEIVTRLLQQVTECGYFITEYAKQKSFWIWVVKYTTSDIDARITGYESRLRELKAAFLERGTLQSGVTVVRMMNTVEHIAESVDLNDMPYALGARHAIEKGCLAGTRESLISEICDILNNPAEDAPRVCLLTGVAGSGKSAVAHSIARLYEDQERLGSSYCFSSSDVARRNPENLFSTIARNLADRDPQYKFALWKIVKDNRALRTSTSLVEQVTRLIIEPIKHLHVIGPLVIVIDALDESGDEASRRQLLRVISAQFSENALPVNLRFLITSRPERDILAAFSSGVHFVHKQMAEIPDHIVDKDIERFIRHSLDQFPELDSSWPNGEWYLVLVHHSQCLFQWASTACSFIEGVGAAGLDFCERLSILVESGHDEFVHSLDGLYGTILGRQFTLGSTQRRFCDVMAIVLSLNEPLSLSSLAALFGSDLKAREIIKPLGSLLDGAFNEDKPIRPLHTSFHDFLLDETRSLVFHVPILPQHSLSLGRAMLRCMQNMLKFNICDLRDSRLRNTEVPDLPNRVNKAIPPYLSYACRYWMSHLQHAECTLELLTEVTLFFKKFFPYWLEAISLLSLSSPLSSILSALGTCTILQTWAKDHEITTLSSEAFRFIQAFAPVLRDSTPHLYLSAMAQTPLNSPLCTLWVDNLQRNLSVTSVHPATWLAEVHVMEGHTEPVSSVAYSPNGRHIVSGSWDNTIRVWDAATGQVVAGPFQGHTDAILSIAYSPDGKYIVSGSRDKTIGIWDAITGQVVAGPFQDHTKSVWSVAFSSDGRSTASGSNDHTIRIWDATTGHAVADPFQGHMGSVLSVAYSPDGRHIASGSEDHTIRVWDVITGQTVADPFQGHSAQVVSVAYSPDGRHVVSGSWDNTIRDWDAITGQTTADPFQGHNDKIQSVAYASNGRHIVSGSWDNTIRVWNAITGHTVAGPFQGHTDIVTCVAWSPDERYIISGSWDKTIRIWDIATGQHQPDAFQGHTNYVCSVTYSPNGRHIVSGSRNNNIKVWDATTGQIITNPFHGHTCTIMSITYSPNGRHIISGSLDGTIRVWDTTTAQSIIFKNYTHCVYSVVYSPDGRHIVATSSESDIRIWDATTTQTIAGPFQGHTPIFSIAYSPDGRHIVSTLSDSTIKVWDLITGQTVTGPSQGHTEGVLSTVSYSPNGKHIASGSSNNIIRVWDATTGKAMAGLFQGHTDSVHSVAFSPDGRHIVSGSRDNTIRIWDAITGQTMAGPFQGHLDYVTSVAYSSDGRYIISGSGDYIIKVWRVQDLFLFKSMLVNKGWIRFSNSTLFAWIAPWNRNSFHLPIHSLVIAFDRGYQVHSDTSLVGESWMSCWK